MKKQEEKHKQHTIVYKTKDYAWFKKTKVGIWFYAKVDAFYTWAAKRYDIEIATKEERAMKKYPYLMKRINDIEKDIKKLKKK